MVVKYRHMSNVCIIKITDGTRIVMKKTKLE